MRYAEGKSLIFTYHTHLDIMLLKNYMCKGLISAFHMRQNASKLYRLNEFLTKRSLLRNKLSRKFDEEEVSVHPDLELDIVNKPWKRRKVGLGYGVK